MTEALDAFPAKLYELRTAQRLTTGALALLVGVAPATVSNWENGVSRPRAVNLPRLADALGVSVMSLRLLTGRAIPTAQNGLRAPPVAQRLIGAGSPPGPPKLASVIDEAKRLIAAAVGTTIDKITVRVEY